MTTEWTFVIQVAIGRPGTTIGWISRRDDFPPFLPPIESIIIVKSLRHHAYVETIATNFVEKEVVVTAACRIEGNHARDVFNHAIENGWVAE